MEDSLKTAAEAVIDRLGLRPLEGEGGYFRELPSFGAGSGSIYYLVTQESFSHLHSLTVDELYFFLEGDPVTQTIVHPDGNIERRTLDSNHRDSIVPQNCFQASWIEKVEQGYALLCTVMSPQYHDSMYHAGKDDQQICSRPELAALL